jgi:hypothetical protein
VTADGNVIFNAVGPFDVIFRDKPVPCNSQANDLWGSTTVPFSRGVATMRNLKLNNSGTFWLRFTPLMTGGSQAMEPRDAEYTVVKTTQSELFVVRQPVAGQAQMPAPIPPRVVMRDFNNNPVFGFTCEGHFCRGADGRFNITAYILRSDGVTTLPALPMDAVQDPVTGEIEFGFTPTFVDKMAMFRFVTTSRATCGGACMC